MSAPRAAARVLCLLLILSLAACGRGQSTVKLPFRLPNGQSSIRLPFKLPGSNVGFDKDVLEDTIDSRFGGVGTCVIIADTKSGHEVYRYNSNGVCMTKYPPCETYEIAGDLVALDAGLITPSQKLNWDRTPQPIESWQQDADLKTAFANSIGWWQARLAAMLGPARLRQALRGLGYGNSDLGPSLDSFWMGPAHGGQLGISTREQAQFLHRLYAGQLPVKPASAEAVEQVMTDETRGDATISGKAGACSSLSDDSRHVAWYVGRLKTPKHDWVFAASLEGETKNALPGVELQSRVKSAFAQAGMWPSGS